MLKNFILPVIDLLELLIVLSVHTITFLSWKSHSIRKLPKRESKKEKEAYTIRTYMNKKRSMQDLLIREK